MTILSTFEIEHDFCYVGGILDDAPEGIQDDVYRVVLLRIFLVYRGHERFLHLDELFHLLYHLVGPVSGSVVDAVPIYGGVVPTPLSATTDSSGTATFSVSWPSGTGAMEFVAGALLPAQLSFP
jgi:hypothetical protein